MSRWVNIFCPSKQDVKSLSLRLLLTIALAVCSGSLISSRTHCSRRGQYVTCQWREPWVTGQGEHGEVLREYPHTSYPSHNSPSTIIFIIITDFHNHLALFYPYGWIPPLWHHHNRLLAFHHFINNLASLWISVCILDSRAGAILSKFSRF